MNPPPAKRSVSLGSPKGIMFIVGAVALVVILLVVIVSVSKGGNPAAKDMVLAAQEQQEIARIASAQVGVVTQQNVQNFVANTSLSMSSDQRTLTGYLGQHGVKVSVKGLKAGMDSSTDAEIANAVTTNSLDPTVQKILQDELAQYQMTLGRAYTNSASPSARALLTQLNDHAQLLIAQSKQ